MDDQFGNKYYRVLRDGVPICRYKSFKHLAQEHFSIIGPYTVEARKPHENWEHFPIEILQAYVAAGPKLSKPGVDRGTPPSPYKWVHYFIYIEGKQIAEIMGRSIARLFCTRLTTPYSVFTKNENEDLISCDLKIGSREDFIKEYVKKAFAEDHLLIQAEIKGVENAKKS